MQPLQAVAQRLGLLAPGQQRQPVLRAARRGWRGRPPRLTARAACARTARSRRAARSRAPGRRAFPGRRRFRCASRCVRRARSRISASETAAAEAMRAFCALPCRSATTRKASPASGSASSSCAPLPLASRKRPRSPRALATRSGQAWRRSDAGCTRHRRLPCAASRRACLRQPLRQAARAAVGARRLLAAKPRQPALEVGAVAAEAALGQQHGKLCGRRRCLPGLAPPRRPCAQAAPAAPVCASPRRTA